MFPGENRFRVLLEAIGAVFGRTTVENILRGKGRPITPRSDDSDDTLSTGGGPPLDTWFWALLEWDRPIDTFEKVASVLVRALSRSESMWRGPERGARELVRDRRYGEAADAVDALISRSGEDAQRLADEFGFLRWDDPDRDFITGLWTVLAEPNQFESRTRIEGRQDGEASRSRASAEHLIPAARASARSESAKGPTGGSGRGTRTAVQSGQVLEEATAKLFASFLALSPQNRSDLINGIRQQHPGTQFGYDVKLTCAAVGNPHVLCHIECKNLAKPVTLRDISDKLLQNKIYYRDSPIDHWILISPHTDPSNELQDMLEHWIRVDEFPFTVQVWSPQSGVRELFSLAPDVYKALYGAAPDGSEPPPETVAETIRGRLVPHLRLAPVWRDYLRKPTRHCIGSEKPDHFDELVKNHVDIKATDASGSILEGSLMDRVLAWLSGPDAAGALLLLADFGEGKSFFTYNLSRRLCDAFVAEPTHGVMPLRIPLGQFKAARDGRRLLERRLGEIGATLADWRDLTASTSCLVILDGFDEMSTDLSQEAMEDNIAGLESCIEELTGSQVRIIVTSRGRAFDVGRNRERVLDRLGQPQILQFSPVPRADRIRYLEGFIDDPTGEQRLATLRDLYDPIGLAAKPLFLQMIRETLTDLPEGEFSELILYRTYVRKSLSRKIKYLRASRVTDSELLDNLLRILEKVAVTLQRTDQQYVYLTDLAGPDPNLARLLWQTRDGVDQASPTGDDADAAARIGIRSLLKAAPAPVEGRWPVTFFHRSMQEYFVACALVRALRDNHELARTVLDDLPPLPEIVHFAASMIHESGDRATVWGVLESFTRSATVSIASKYLGGHAITLLHSSGGTVPKADCSRLRLDYANLDGVDLSEARMVEASLRHANLDNANLESADLSGADLEGVRLEETSSVVGLTALGNDQIVAAYDDQSIRSWRRKPGGQWRSRILGSVSHDIERIQVTPGGRLLASGGNVLSVFSLSSSGLICDSRFPTKPPLRSPLAGVSTAVYEQELPGGRTQVVWMNLQTLTARHIEPAGEPAVCYAQLDNTAFAVATESSVRLTTPVKGTADFTTVGLGLHNVNCIDMRTSPDGSILLAFGHRDGVLTLAASKSNEIVERWRVRRHDAMVSAIVFADGDKIISGGLDRSVRVTPIATGEVPEGDPIMRLTLRCAGVRYDGVRTERERLMLATAASSEPGQTQPD